MILIAPRVRLRAVKLLELAELLEQILSATAGSGVPLGINVESVSIFREEIDAAHELFRRLQAIILNSYGSPWSVKWYAVYPRSTSNDDLTSLLLKKSAGTLVRKGDDVSSTQSGPGGGTFEKATMLALAMGLGLMLGRETKR